MIQAGETFAISTRSKGSVRRARREPEEGPAPSKGDPVSRKMLPAAIPALLLVAVLGLPALAFADQGEPPVAASEILEAHARARVDPHRIPRASSEIVIDGVLDEPAWDEALRLDLAYEVWPGDNNEATVRTEALLAYDASNLYAAFRAHDPEPDLVRARLTDRDSAFSDDFVGLVVDTFNDERRAFEFFVNAMGVQMDLVQDDVSGREDSSWDAIWDSAGRLTEEGYVVELAIPYTSLRFQRQEGDQVWGLDLIRIYPRDQRYLLAMNPRNRDVNCYLCQVGKIIGFAGATPGKNLEITPTVTAIRTDEAPPEKADPNDPNSPFARFSQRGLEAGEMAYDPGITARWGMTPNLTLSGTVNPDFSQVEADAAQLNVNERFALFFREKRPFFLEGADFFETPLRAVHTRTVADPKWGTKVTGKEGKHAIGTFVAEDEFTTVMFPGSQGSSGASFNQSVSDGVFRYRRDLGESSAIGGLVTVREGSGNDYYNRVAGADGLFRMTKKDTLRVQILGSQTRYPEEHPDDPNVLITLADDPADTRDSFEQPRGAFTDQAYILNYSHNTKTWDVWARHQEIGSRFRSDLGFIPQVDVRLSLAGYEYTWWGQEGEDWYSRFRFGGDVDETADLDGNLIERELEGWFNFSGPMQSFLFLGAGKRKFGWRDDTFDQEFVNFWADLRPTSNLWVGLSSGFSKRVDFAFEDPAESGAARQGDEFRIGPEIGYNFGRHLRIDLFHTMRQLRIDEGRLFRANQTQMNLALQFNVRTFFRAVVQYTDVARDTDLYPDCVADPTGCGLEERSEGVFTQLLFSYKVNPQTALFVGYTENQAGGSDVELGLDRVDLTRQDRTLFFKIGYAWVQ
jgi:hypothetical protein